MRVFHLCAGAPTGGAEMAFVDTCLALHDAGMTITPICRPHPSMVSRLRAGGLDPVTLPFGGWFDFQTGPALRRLIRAERPDIVQSWMNRAARFVPRRRFDLPPFHFVPRLGGYYKLKYYNGADHIITNTPDIRRYVIDGGIPAERVTHINNFADIKDDHPPIERAALTTDAQDFVFLTLARLHTVKGIDLFIRAMARMPENCVGWIAGDGPEEATLKELARNTGVYERLRWLGWRDDRTALLRAADAFVFPSRFEPFGNSFAQAWGTGCPLITTASEGPMQYVQDQVDALVSPIDDVDYLVQNMLLIIKNKELRDKIVLNGTMRFGQEFTRIACVQNYKKLYQDLLETV